MTECERQSRMCIREYCRWLSYQDLQYEYQLSLELDDEFRAACIMEYMMQLDN